jgi:hypothetical protein
MIAVAQIEPLFVILAFYALFVEAEASPTRDTLVGGLGLRSHQLCVLCNGFIGPLLQSQTEGRWGSTIFCFLCGIRAAFFALAGSNALSFERHQIYTLARKLPLSPSRVGAFLQFL